MKHIHFSMPMVRLSGHPQKIMEELGITYQRAVPQTIGDSWEFWCCENVPDELPEGLTIKDWNPMDRIGWGLSKEDAEEIRDYTHSVNRR
jgi:hypothetical protein